jgi:hypothetical protein
MSKSSVLGVLILLFGIGQPNAASRLFSYYSPLSARSFGIGGAGCADVADHANAAANPATVSFLRGATISVLFAPLSIPPLDFDYHSAFVALGADARVGTSTVLNGAIGGAFRRDRIQLSVPGVDETVDDTYEAFVGGGIESRRMRIGVGIGAKWYPVGLTTGEEESVSLIDVGTVINFGRIDYGGLSFGLGGGYSRMNIGEPIEDPALGPIDAPEFDRFGVMIVCRHPAGSAADAQDDETVAVSVNFDIETEVGASTGKREHLGGEVSLWRVVFLRAGYIHDELTFRGARDGTLGAAVRWTRGLFGVSFDFARWPYSHDEYGNVFGLSATYHL